MVSLWNSKKDKGDNSPRLVEDDDEDRPTSSSRNDPVERRSRDSRRSQEADERTRLLPPPSNHGYLDPSDPAVSPYNLWSVRALRYLSVLFLAITFVWWVLLFVSIFVSPPGMHSRGSGFFDVSFTTLTFGNLLVGLLFFTVPSKALEVSNIILSVFLFIDMVIILAQPRLRVEEGWVGIAAVVWAFLMSLFNVLTDRVVAWGKKEEEERLTGRQETRRSVREWCAVMTYTVINIILIIVVILMTGTLSVRARDATLQAPGEKYYVDDGKYQVHLDCVGNLTYAASGKPDATVLIEHGEEAFEYTLEPFIHSAYKNGSISRYCYWDRPGFAFSDNAPSPHSAGMSAEALANALAQAGEEGPWVLMSAGIGSIHSRIFSSRHIGDVKGLLLVDPLHEDLLYKVASPGNGFLLWAYGFISPLGLERLFAAIFKGRTREDRVYGKTAYSGGKNIKARLQENLVANSLTRSEVSSARNIQQKDTPLVVISSGIKVRSDEQWEKKQKDLTKITDTLVAWDVVNKAPHQVWKTFEGRKKIEKRLSQLVRA